MKKSESEMADRNGLVVRVPPGKYYVLRTELESGRSMVVALPEGMTSEEADEASAELGEIRNIVAGWGRTGSTG